MPPNDSIMPFQSDSRATGIAEYTAIFIPCYHQNQLRVAIRSVERDGHGYFLLADPYMLTTHVVLKSDIQHRKPSVGPNDSAYYHKADFNNTPYGMTLKRVQQSTPPTENDGITPQAVHENFLLDPRTNPNLRVIWN